MSILHFIGGEKGGIGKSVLSRLLSQYLLDKSIPYVGVDADQSHATLSRYYADFTRPINLDVFESTDTIMDLATSEDRHVVIDLPAQSQRFLDRWIDESGVLEMCDEIGMSLMYWYTVDDGSDSAQLLEAFLKHYGKVLSCVVVKNHGRGSDFAAVDAVLEKYAERMDELYAVDLPALHTETMHKIDKLNFSFWAAMNVKSENGPQLSLMERQRTKVWISKSYTLFDGIMNKLDK